MTSADILGERARLTPEHLAVVVAETAQRLSYRELDARATCCGRIWTETLRLVPGDRFGILALNRLEYLDAFFAAGKTGVVLVPLGTRLTATELAAIVADSGMKGLFYDDALATTVAELCTLVALEHTVAFDRPALGDLSYHDLCAALPAPADREVATTHRGGPEHPYCLLYTSGTTGTPKGVVIPNRMVVFNGYNTVCSWQLRADDVSPIFTPLYHAGGLMAFLVPIFVIGGTIVLHQAFDADAIWHSIAAERCTVVLGVPTIWKLLLETPAFATTNTSSLRWLISGGAPLPHYLIAAYQARGLVFKQGFGMTEVGVNCFAMTVEDSYRKVGSIGKPMMGTEVRLVDADGQDVAPGEVGELLFRGPHVCAGYWNNPQATAKALDENGWFHSGDLATCDGDGFYFVAGRHKDMIISGGVNIYPAEIEGALLLHPAVTDAAVVGVPHPQWGEVGIAFLVVHAPIDPEEVTSFLAKRLARYKLPRVFRQLESLPRTAYGKVVKGQLRDLYLAEPT